MIEKRALGRSQLSVTRLGYGAGPIGHLHRVPTDEMAVAAVQAAWDAGIRYFDTAPLYGSGVSERRLGSFLRRQPRDAFVLSTKVGRLLRESADGSAVEIIYDYSGDGARRSLEESMARLGLDRVDVVFVHDIDIWTHGDEQPQRMREALDGAFPALMKLRSEGVIGAVGVGVNEWEVCRDVALACDIDCVLLAGRFTLLEQGAAAEFLPLCRERNIGVVIGGPYNSGILATGSAGAGTYNYTPPPAAVVERVRRLETVVARHGVTLPVAALRYLLREPSVAAIIPGMISLAEVTAAVTTLDSAIPEALWTDLRDNGLIP